MKFGRVAVLGTLAWMTAITILHVCVNMGGWRWGRAEKETFKVGFLPVT